jgi:predicted GH43/DUF377 family glycosyl hydrolase
MDDDRASICRSRSKPFVTFFPLWLIIAVCWPFFSGASLIDLEDRIGDFVVETKKLDIPGFPEAFNPSIIRWRGKLLLSFRFYHPETRSTNPIGLVHLDDEFRPIGSPQVLEIPFKDPYSIDRRQDPRLIAAGEHLFLVYNNMLEPPVKPEIRRMVIAELFFDGALFFGGHPDCFIHFDDESPERTEKNWVPFVHDGALLLARTINPHCILHPLLGRDCCETLYSTRFSIPWKWGVPRGGTPALLVDGEYLAFFHSSTNLRTVHSDGKLMQHYFMGAYTFSGSPPFKMTRISQEPIVGINFYHGLEYQTWKPLRVVFPAGYVFDDEFIWVAYGRQDHEVWIVKLDRKKLLDSLVPVTDQ